MVVPDEIAASFDREIARHRRKEHQSSPLTSLNHSAEVARERVMREIEARQGARSFRDALMRAYQGQCAITGCAVPELLEAAHIIPYADQGANTTTNGLLLRTDLHTLFDRHLIWIGLDRKVRVAPVIKDPAYRVLHGKRLRSTLCDADAPLAELLRQHAAKRNSGVP